MDTIYILDNFLNLKNDLKKHFENNEILITLDQLETKLNEVLAC